MLFRFCPDDHMLRAQGDPVPAPEAVPHRRDAAGAGRPPHVALVHDEVHREWLTYAMDGCIVMPMP